MKKVPKEFLVLLVLLLVFTFFTGAYVIAEGAVEGQPGIVYAGLESQRKQADDLPSNYRDREWYESASVWVCPLH